MSCLSTVFFETGSLAGLECPHFIKLVRQQAEFYRSTGVSTSSGILSFFFFLTKILRIESVISGSQG